MDCPTTRDCTERLKRHGSALGTIEVRDGAGTVTTVAVPRVRTKWARIARTLDELQWRTVRALDSGGQLLELLELLTADDEQLDDGDDVEQELPDEMEQTYRFAERVVQLTMRAQREALAPYVRSQQTMVDGMSKLLGVLTERLVQLERMFGTSLKLAHESALAGAGEESGSGDAIMAMLGQVMHYQAVQKAAAAAAAPAPATPKNGTP